jgi:hypothetical protein
VSGNIATGGGNAGTAYGGGLYLAGATVSLSNVTVSGNTAQGGDAFAISPHYGSNKGVNGGNGYGGGVYLDATLTAATFRDVTVENNIAKGGHGVQGGIDGAGYGGGLFINLANSVCLDAFTVAHVIHNSADFYPNIDGPYTICP